MEQENDPLTFEKLFQRDLFFLKLMGLSSMNGILSERKLIKKWWDGLPIVIGTMIIITVVAYEFRTLYKVAGQQRDYAIQLFSFVCSGSLCALKLIRILMNYLELYNVLQKLRIMWKSAQFENSITQKMIETALNTKRITKYYSMLIFSGISFSVRPYVLFLNYRLHENISFDFSQTVYPGNLPFTVDSFVIYFTCVTYEQIVCFAVVVSWISGDTLFAQLTTHISLQFTIIANELQMTIDNCNLKNNQNAAQKIANIVEKHQQLFMFCYSIEMFFNPIIFCAVVSNALNVCCCIFYLDQAIAVGNWDEIASNSGLLTTLSIQTVIFCSFAHTLTTTSAKISDTVYHSQWTDCNQKLKRILLIIMIRAQKEHTYTAYGFITLNLQQLTNISNAAVSYFMLLRSLS